MTVTSSEKKELQPEEEKSPAGCCYSTHLRNCFLVIGILGTFLIAFGLIVLTLAPSFLSKFILKSLALTPNSARLDSWLTPPVQPHLTVYAFNVTNPEEVILGLKPKLEEVGPFIYKAVTVKDSIDYKTRKSHLSYDDDGPTLTYRPRKYYYLVSGNPDETFVTVPNIPMITAFSNTRNSSMKSVSVKIIKNTGLGTPFINVSVSGLLWGYQDDLPCLKMARPNECPPEEDKFFDDDDDYEWGGEKWDARRKKRSVDEEELLSEKKKAGYVDCKCQWGLFRDRNATLRKPVTVNHGMMNISRKGWVEKYDGSSTFGWWKKGSSCDEVGGVDGATLPPQVNKNLIEMDMFISVLCRKISLYYEKNTFHSGMVSHRFIPPPNTFGSHNDPNNLHKNEDNECYCRIEDGFSCLKSGALNLEPCKVTEALPLGAPLAISFPHFYEADLSYLESVEGLQPHKGRHQFYVDVEPTLGFPLAIRPRFQLNIIIRKDEEIDIMSQFPEELVLPFLWAEDGFGDPSEVMASAIQFGLAAPNKIPLYGGIAFIAVGALMIFTSLLWTWCCAKRRDSLEAYELKFSQSM